MTLRSLGFSFAVLLSGFMPCYAQRPLGPLTLENLLEKDGEVEAERASKAVMPAAQVEPLIVRPRVTLVRPKDGVRHPDLDKAWLEYDAAIATATEGIKDAINKRLDAAVAKGDLDDAKKWQAALGELEGTGVPPACAETKSAVSAAITRYAKASSELTEAYQAVVVKLTMDNELVAAESVRDESTMLSTFIEECKAAIAHEQQHAVEKDNAVFLSDLKERGVFVGYGAFGKNDDLGYDGAKIVVAGRAVKKGLSMHPASNGIAAVTYAVPEGCTHLEARVAMNDTSTKQKTPVVFQVMRGKHLLWQSRPLSGVGVGEDCVVPLKAAMTVTLIVRCPGSKTCAHAVWVDARFVRK